MLYQRDSGTPRFLESLPWPAGESSLEWQSGWSTTAHGAPWRNLSNFELCPNCDILVKKNLTFWEKKCEPGLKLSEMPRGNNLREGKTDTRSVRNAVNRRAAGITFSCGLHAAGAKSWTGLRSRRYSLGNTRQESPDNKSFRGTQISPANCNYLRADA